MTRLTRDWTAGRLYWAALVIAVPYLLVSPIFTVPDESAHLWRALAFARGSVAPASRPAPATLAVDESRRLFTWHVHDTLDRTGRYDLSSMAVTWQLRWMDEERNAGVVPLYTPIAYLPQSLASGLAEIVRFRPMILFYLGRAANLTFWLLLVAAAVRIAPQCAPIFAAVTLLPMSLYLFASWSADAAGIALAILFTALVVRAVTGGGTISWRDIVTLAAVALLLTLCKPPYAVLTALAALVPIARLGSHRRAAVALAVIAVAALAGTLTSMMWFDRAYFNMRPGLPVDPAAQVECIRHAPARFAGVIASDVRRHTLFYLEQAVGRLGHNEIILHPAVVRLAWAMLLVTALTTRTGVSRRVRVGSLLIFFVIASGIIVSQYVIWSIVCGDDVEGVQGRYFLPILPLLMIGIGGFFRRSIPAFALLIVAVILNGAAIGALLVRYW